MRLPDLAAHGIWCQNPLMVEDPNASAADPSLQRARLRRNLLRLGIFLVLVWAASRLIGWAHGLAPLVDGGGAGLSFAAICALLCAYAMMLALPYVPGIEVGLALLMLEGAWVAPIVWVATVAGLLMSYCAGQWLPYGLLERWLRDLGLRRAADHLARIAPLDRAARQAMLRDGLPVWLSPLSETWRYPVLAVLVNLPGNIALGGGGGLMLFAGVSRLFAPLPTALTVTLAVSPIPLAVWFFGCDGLV